MLPLPMTARQCADDVIAACFDSLLPGRFDGRAERVMLLAAMLHASRLQFRRQPGAALSGLLQLDQRAVHRVLNSAGPRKYARAVCLLHAVAPTDGDLHRALGHDDVLCCAIGRLLMAVEPVLLPAVGAVELAWSYYLRTFEPADADHAGWENAYREAVRALA